MNSCPLRVPCHQCLSQGVGRAWRRWQQTRVHYISGSAPLGSTAAPENSGDSENQKVHILQTCLRHVYDSIWWTPLEIGHDCHILFEGDATVPAPSDTKNKIVSLSRVLFFMFMHCRSSHWSKSIAKKCSMVSSKGVCWSWAAGVVSMAHAIAYCCLWWSIIEKGTGKPLG